MASVPRTHIADFHSYGLPIHLKLNFFSIQVLIRESYKDIGISILPIGGLWPECGIRFRFPFDCCENIFLPIGPFQSERINVAQRIISNVGVQVRRSDETPNWVRAKKRSAARGRVPCPVVVQADLLIPLPPGVPERLGSSR